MTVRVIHDPPQAGAVNMAADEALLSRVGTEASPPTLRFYQWNPPTISLGYFQKYAEYQQLPPPAGDLDVVRRQTGGGAILHDRELTYSLALPLDHPLLIGGPNQLYEQAHDAVITCLGAFGIDSWRGCDSDGSGAGKGPFFCFARRHCFDVLIGGDKVAGSAQRRTAHAVLQHGSIILEPRFGQQPTASGKELAHINLGQLAERFTAALAELTGTDFISGDWTEPERQTTAELVAKYQGPQWTRRI